MEWIKTSDRVPDNNREVVTYSHAEGETIGVIDVAIYQCKRGMIAEQWVVIGQGKGPRRTPSHWQELPKSPEGFTSFNLNPGYKPKSNALPKNRISAEEWKNIEKHPVNGWQSPSKNLPMLRMKVLGLFDIESAPKVEFLGYMPAEGDKPAHWRSKSSPEPLENPPVLWREIPHPFLRERQICTECEKDVFVL